MLGCCYAYCCLQPTCLPQCFQNMNKSALVLLQTFDPSNLDTVEVWLEDLTPVGIPVGDLLS
jgi:hypothetical protein